MISPNIQSDHRDAPLDEDVFILKQLSEATVISHLLLTTFPGFKSPCLVLTDRSSIYIYRLEKDGQLELVRQRCFPRMVILLICEWRLGQVVKGLVAFSSDGVLNFIKCHRKRGQLHITVIKRVSIHSLQTDFKMKRVDTEPKMVSDGRRIVVSYEDSIFEHPTDLLTYDKIDKIKIGHSIPADMLAEFLVPQDVPPQCSVYFPDKHFRLCLYKQSHSIVPVRGAGFSKPPNSDGVFSIVNKLGVKRTSMGENAVYFTCLVDQERVLVVKENGTVYLEYISVSKRRKLRCIDAWHIMELGQLAPFSKILHLSENLFFSYSKVGKSAIWKIDSQAPHLRILRYFDKEHFKTKQSLLWDPQKRQVEENSPVRKIERIVLANLNLYVKLQTTKWYSCISMQCPLHTNIKKLELTFFRPKRPFANIHFSSLSNLVFNTGSDVVIWGELGEKELVTFKSCGAILICKNIGNALIIVTTKAVLYYGPSETKSEIDLGSKILMGAVTSDSAVLITANGSYLLQLSENLIKRLPDRIGITCIGSNDQIIALGFMDGSLDLGNERIIRVSRVPLKQVIVKKQYLVVLDCDFSLFKVSLCDGGVKEYTLGSEFFELRDLISPEQFLVLHRNAITLNKFENGELITWLVDFRAGIPEHFNVIGDEYIYYEAGQIRRAKILSDPQPELRQYYVNDVITNLTVLPSDDVVFASDKTLSLLDLDSFKVVQNFSLGVFGERTATIGSVGHAINPSKAEDVLDLEKSLHDSGIFVAMEGGSKDSTILLFLIGQDRKIRLQTSEKAPSYLNFVMMDDGLLALGKTSHVYNVEIEENNAGPDVPRFRLISSVLVSHRASLKDLVRLTESCILTLDVTMTMRSFCRDLGQDGSWKQMEMCSNAQEFNHSYCILMQASKKEYLILTSLTSDIQIYRYRVKDAVLILELHLSFNLPGVVISSITPSENARDDLCLLGCTNGGIISLEKKNINDAGDDIRKGERLFNKYARITCLTETTRNDFYKSEFGSTVIDKLTDLRSLRRLGYPATEN